MTDSTPALIPLYRRTYLVGYALMDPEDAERFKHLTWYLDKNGYVVSKNRSVEGTTYMHRMVTDAPDGEVVDHANHIRSDNRKANLRVCGKIQNSANTRKMTGRYGFRGISYHKESERYYGLIMVNKHRRALGGYATAEEAAKAYDSAARQLHGEFAILNFPDIEAFPGVDWEAVALKNKKVQGNRKLTLEVGEAIRTRYAAGEQVRDLAAEYGVSRDTIYDVINRKGY